MSVMSCQPFDGVSALKDASTWLSLCVARSDVKSIGGSSQVFRKSDASACVPSEPSCL